MKIIIGNKYVDRLTGDLVKVTSFYKIGNIRTIVYYQFQHEWDREVLGRNGYYTEVFIENFYPATPLAKALYEA